MSRTITRRLPVAALVLLIAGCVSVTTWQGPGAITPMSFRESRETPRRSVGKLRRLVLAPVRYTYDPAGAVAEAATVRAVWEPAATRALADGKGYDVLPLALFDDVVTPRLGVSAEQLGRDLDRLGAWARESSDGQPPAAEIAGVVGRLGRVLDADGLVVVQGFGKLARLLSGPTLLEMRADIYEVASGRIVWRNRVRGGASRACSPCPTEMAFLFERLEHAVPEVDAWARSSRAARIGRWTSRRVPSCARTPGRTWRSAKARSRSSCAGEDVGDIKPVELNRFAVEEPSPPSPR